MLDIAGCAFKLLDSIAWTALQVLTVDLGKLSKKRCNVKLKSLFEQGRCKCEVM